MSEEDAALSWEVDPDPNPTSRSESIDPAPYSEKAAPAEGISPGMAILPVPETTHSFQAVECSPAQAPPSDTVQDTKPAEQPRVTTPPATSDPSSDQQQATEPSEKSLNPEGDTGVKITPRGETMGLNEKPLEVTVTITLIETNPLGLTQPKDIRVRCEDRRRANLKTPVEAACTSKDLWTALPFTQATWR